MMQSHFAPTSLQDITISERQFPFPVRADLQRAIDRLFSAETRVSHEWHLNFGNLMWAK
jgi:hypothetical protein